MHLGHFSGLCLTIFLQCRLPNLGQFRYNMNEYWDFISSNQQRIQNLTFQILNSNCKSQYSHYRTIQWVDISIEFPQDNSTILLITRQYSSYTAFISEVLRFCLWYILAGTGTGWLAGMATTCNSMTGEHADPLRT